MKPFLTIIVLLTCFGCVKQELSKDYYRKCTRETYTIGNDTLWSEFIYTDIDTFSLTTYNYLVDRDIKYRSQVFLSLKDLDSVKCAELNSYRNYVDGIKSEKKSARQSRRELNKLLRKTRCE